MNRLILRELEKYPYTLYVSELGYLEVAAIQDSELRTTTIVGQLDGNWMTTNRSNFETPRMRNFFGLLRR